MNAILTAEVICLGKYSTIQTTAVQYLFKKNYLLKQQRFSTQNSTLFSLSNSRDFSYSKGKNPVRMLLTPSTCIQIFLNPQLFLSRFKIFPFTQSSQSCKSQVAWASKDKQNETLQWFHTAFLRPSTLVTE